MMKRSTRNGLIGALLAGCAVLGFSIGLLSGAGHRPADGEHLLTLCETTDVHGAYFPRSYDGSDNAASLANVSSALAELRAAGDVVLIDCGDNLQGDNAAFYYNYVDTLSDHVYAAMAETLGYDALVVGNHDIETGHSVYDRLKKRYSMPLLAANAVHDGGRHDGKPYFTPYTVIRRGGLRIAVIGMTNANIKAWLTQEKWSGINFLPISDIAGEWVERVRRKERPDVVVLAVHSGAGTGEGPDIENEGRFLAATLPGVDIVLCGHDHRPCIERFTHEDGSVTLLMDAGSKARAMAVAELRLTVSRGRVVSRELSGKLLQMADYAPDSAFVARFAPQFEAVRAYALRSVATLTAPLSFEDALDGPSAYMSLIHRAQLHFSGADVSLSAPLANHGSLPAGEVSFLDLTRIYKYENLLTVVPLTGLQLKNYLEYSYDHWIRREGPSYNYDSAAGIRYTVSRGARYGERVTILSMADGRPFDPEATYRVAMTSYRSSGAGGLLTEGAGVDPASLPSLALFKDIRSLVGEYLGLSGPYTPTADTNWSFTR